jgi:hypothetical protein
MSKVSANNQEVTGSSRGNSLLQNLQGKDAYRNPKWVRPFPEPVQSGSFMHQAAPFFIYMSSIPSLQK